MTDVYMVTFLSIAILLIGFLLGVILIGHVYESDFDNRSVEKGYAEYNSKTGKLYYLDKDVKYLLYGEE
jgi:hypothetical protein